MSLATWMASRQASAAPCEMAGVMPVQWNQSALPSPFAPLNTAFQSIMPGSDVRDGRVRPVVDHLRAPRHGTGL